MIRSAFSAPVETEPLDHDNVIDSINEYFEDFEYKVYSNRFAEIDKRITYLIIRKFKRLFEMWEENAAFSKFLESDSFREIFASMYNEFGFNHNKTSSAECYLECELCGEEIVLRNNDPEYSYRVHETTKYHVEFVRNLKAIRTDEEIDLIFNQNTNEKGTFLECHLCLVFIPISARDSGDDLTNARFVSVMDSHQLEEKHRLNMEIFGANKSHIKVYNLEEKLYACSPCQEIYHVDLLMDHLKSSTHAENVSKEHVPKKTIERNDVGLNVIDKTDFEVFKTNMELIHVIDDAIQCSLCGSNLTSVNMVVEHLTGKEHTKNLENYMKTPPAPAPAIVQQAEEVEELVQHLEVDDAKCECDQPIIKDVPVEEIPKKEEYRGRWPMFKMNYVSSICLIVVFSISAAFWY